MNILSPSMLSADYTRLGEQLKELESAGVRYLHVDVMDGIFVPSISFGMPVIASIRGVTDMVFDVHLMIDRPERYIKEFAECGADLINFHLEATDKVQETIAEIRRLGKRVGITIKPQTPAEAVRPYIGLVDMILVMTVEPGFGGQKLIPDCIPKITEISNMLKEAGLDGVDIEVDGGVNPDNVRALMEAGANVIVAGSAVFKGDLTENVMRFRELMQ